LGVGTYYLSRFCSPQSQLIPLRLLQCIARVIQGASSAVVWVLALVLVCESVPEAIIGQQLGIAMAGTSIGLACGPPVSFLLSFFLLNANPFLIFSSSLSREAWRCALRTTRLARSYHLQHHRRLLRSYRSTSHPRGQHHQALGRRGEALGNRLDSHRRRRERTNASSLHFDGLGTSQSAAWITERTHSLRNDLRVSSFSLILASHRTRADPLPFNASEAMVRSFPFELSLLDVI